MSLGRARATTLGCKVSWVLPRVPSVSALPLDFFGRLRLLETLHVPAAVHGAEAAVVSQDALRKLRVAFVRAVWSDGLNLTSPGAVLNLLDGPVGCDTGYHVAWCGFRMLRRHLAYNSEVHERSRIHELLRVVSASAPGLVPFIFCSQVLPLQGVFGFLVYVPGSGLDCLIFVRFPVHASTSSLRSRMLGDVSSRAWFFGLPLS